MCHRCTPTSITTHLTTTAQPMSVLAYNGVNKSAVFANIHQFIRISQKIESWWGCFDSDSAPLPTRFQRKTVAARRHLTYEPGIIPLRYRDPVHMAILRISHRVLSFGTCLYANEQSERSIIKELNYSTT